MSRSFSIIDNKVCRCCGGTVERVEFKDPEQGWDYYIACRSCGSESYNEDIVAVDRKEYFSHCLKKILD